MTDLYLLAYLELVSSIQLLTVCSLFRRFDGHVDGRQSDGARVITWQQVTYNVANLQLTYY